MNNEVKHPYFRIFEDLLGMFITVSLFISTGKIWIRLLSTVSFIVTVKDIYNTVKYIQKSDGTEGS